MPFTGPTEDRLAIRELLDAYADAVVRNDAAAWGECWAKDAYWSMPDYPEFGTPTGRENIVATWVEAMKHYPGVIFVSNPGSIEVDGDTAKVTAYTSEVYNDAGGNVKRDRGTYEDTCIREDGRWVFQRRIFRNIHRG
ncbi:nuclear transport factor 2 family protein [Sphingomonas profundi]|uniref:nuclear transport factor 2 family protein n=1 Tax=Alterirhizorhabdus profundi TaxID=2681549 RepID=UPI0012E8B3D7|nr:nuclear transport factor 2 family protein [Sphingomonas profundi]